MLKFRPLHPNEINLQKKLQQAHETSVKPFAILIYLHMSTIEILQNFPLTGY